MRPGRYVVPRDIPDFALPLHDQNCSNLVGGDFGRVGRLSGTVFIPVIMSHVQQPIIFQDCFLDTLKVDPLCNSTSYRKI
jgi:hypothetical protein